MQESEAWQLVADTPDDQPLVFAAPGAWVFPDLGKRIVPAGARVDTAVEEAAWSVYDTADGDLERYGASLTRTGPDWLLQLEELEITSSAVAPGVPVELRGALLGVRAGLPLRRVRDVQSRRVTRVIVDADNAVLGEIDDLWQRAADGTGSRRIEVIAVDRPFGAAVGRRLSAAGAERQRSRPPQRTTSVGDAVAAFVEAQRREILRGDVRLRRGDDAIHPTRVAVRRLRSVLRVVAVFDREAAASLDRELAWYSAALGQVRDADVLRAHFAASLDQLPDEAPHAETAAALATALAARDSQARSTLRAAMRGHRYLALLRGLRSWADDPPFTPTARKPAKRLAGYSRAADQTMEKRVAQASDADSTHRARKAAKRARYVAEFVADALGTGEDRAEVLGVGKQARKLQAALGDQQDAAMAADFVAGLITATDRPLPPAAAFGCGILWTAERHRAAG